MFPSHDRHEGVTTSITPAIKVGVYNRFGLLDSADNSTSVTIAKTTGSGTISGTLTRTASSGIATFDDIQFSSADDYTITASASGLTSAVSNSFTITTTSSFEPTDISGLRAWYKSSDGITKDGSDRVSAWDDQENSNNLVQSTANEQPLWVDSQLNGYPPIVTGKHL